MTRAGETRQSPGSVRPGGRTARTRSAVLEAVFAELGESGYANLTIERVAQRSGVHQATIYRRWRSVEGLVCELLTEVSRREIPVPDTGSLRADLHGLCRAIAAFYEVPRHRALLDAILSAAARDPEAGQVLADFFAERHAFTAQIVDRAIDRGELAPDTDRTEVIGAIGAPLYFRMLIVRRPVTVDVIERAAELAYLAATSGLMARRS